MRAYRTPSTMEEALSFLREERGSARVAAGATDLYLDLNSGKKCAEVLVDIRRIPKLRSIRETGGGELFIGAAVTHSEIEEDPVIRSEFRALSLGAGSVGGPQIRRIGTIGGNVINAQPAADTAVPLFAFDAEAEIAGPDGIRRVSIDALYAGPGRSTLDSTSEILTGFYLKRGRLPASSFQRMARRKALSLPMLNVAAALRIEGGRIADAALAAGPVASHPMRLCGAEAVLAGQPVRNAEERKRLFQLAGREASCEAHPRDSRLRGSSGYRRELLSVLVERALEECVRDDISCLEKRFMI